MTEFTKDEAIFLQRVALKMKALGFDNPDNIEQDMETAMKAVLEDDKRLWLLSATNPEAYRVVQNDITQRVYNQLNAA